MSVAQPSHSDESSNASEFIGLAIASLQKLTYGFDDDSIVF